MAAEREHVKDQQQDERDEVGALDVLSAKFDPLKALYAREEEVQLPCSTVNPLDNLSQYESMVRGTAAPSGPNRLAASQNVSSSSTTYSERLDTKPTTSTWKSRRTVVDFTREPHLKPFLLLRDCTREKSRVYVWVRHIAGVRGILQGTPVLFDHHFNLLLADAWEVYLPFCESKRKHKQKRKRIRKKQQRQTLPPQHVGLVAEDISSEESETCNPRDMLGSNPPPPGDSCDSSLKHKQIERDWYPPECRSLLDLFRKHCTDMKTRHLRPRWQYSEMMFVRGDCVVMVTKVTPESFD